MRPKITPKTGWPDGREPHANMGLSLTLLAASFTRPSGRDL
jgi:hypothetical protein